MQQDHPLFQQIIFACRLENALGDGFCHDAFNIKECGYDNGDCCLDTVYTNACSECECLEQNKAPLFTRVGNCPPELAVLVGDGNCDDETNFPM